VTVPWSSPPPHSPTAECSVIGQSMGCYWLLKLAPLGKAINFSSLSPPFTSPILKTIAEVIRQRSKLYLFAAIYTDTPHVVERVITPFPCSAISPQRSLSPQYDSCCTVDHHDDDYSADDVDDILSQSSMSPGPPSPHSGISLQGSLNSPATVIPTAVSMVDTTMVTSHPHNRL